MIETFLEGVRWGVWLLGASVPIAGVAVTAVTLFRLLGRETVVVGELVEDDGLPDLDFDFDEDPETFRPEVDVRYMPSTIVRPPNVVSREEAEEDDDDKDD